MASSKGSDSTKSSRYNAPWAKYRFYQIQTMVLRTMVVIAMRAFLKRFEGHEEALFESHLKDLNARAEQKRRLGKNNALNVVYSYLVEMCSPNVTSSRACNK